MLTVLDPGADSGEQPLGLFLGPERLLAEGVADAVDPAEGAEVEEVARLAGPRPALPDAPEVAHDAPCYTAKAKLAGGLEGGGCAHESAARIEDERRARRVDQPRERIDHRLPRAGTRSDFGAC